MLPAFISTVLFAISAVSAARRTRRLGAMPAEFWWLTLATLLLGLWAPSANDQTRRTVNDWAAGELRPSLGSLLALEYCFGANAIDWITRNILIPDLPLARALERVVIDRIRAAPRHHSAEKVRAALTAAMETKEYPPPSLRAVCLRLGYDQTVASRKCPELAESIMARFRSFQTESKRTREYFMRQTLESAVNQLLWEGRSLSFHQLAKVLPPHISIRDKRVLQEFKRLRKEAEDEIQAVMQEQVVPAQANKALL